MKCSHCDDKAIVDVYRHTDGKDYHAIVKPVRAAIFDAGGGAPTRKDTGVPLVSLETGEQVFAEGFEVDLHSTLKHQMTEG